jgi:hypothetical protein
MIIYIEPIWFKPRTYLDYDAVTRKNQGGFDYFILPSLVGEVHAIESQVMNAAFSPQSRAVSARN